MLLTSLFELGLLVEAALTSLFELGLLVEAALVILVVFGKEAVIDWMSCGQWVGR